MNLSEKEQYSKDPYTKNYGADLIKKMLLDKYGERYIKYREDWDKAGAEWLPDYPINLVLDLVDLCNLACPQCLRAPDLMKDYDGYIGTKKFLDFKVISNILEESKEFNLPSVNIGGSGECTLHPNFLEICKKVMEVDPCEFRIITNGIKLDEDVATALINMQVHMLSISIDGFSKETFAESRGLAHRYELVVENAVKFSELKKKMKSEWPLLRVSFVEQESNKHETQEFIDFWTKYADMVDVQVYHDFRMEDGFDLGFDCFEPFKRLTIWAYGGAGPCCGFPGIQYNVGDFAKKSISEIWHGTEIQRIRDMMVNKNFEMPCLKCQGSRTVI